MIAILIYVVIAVIVLSFLYWIVQNFVPDPMKKFAMLVLAAIGVICLIYILLGLVGGGPVSMPHLAR
jgi:hypothetical protein